MYPKNAASPPRIAIGPVVQISDGAVQTSGCTVRVRPEGGAEADGSGTTSYSTDGIVCYVPTQAETNYSAFILIAKKTGCIPSAISVVTTATATPGTVVVTTNNDKTAYQLAADQAVNVTKVNGTAQTAGDLAALINVIDGIVDTIVSRVLGTILAGNHNPQSGDAYARLGAAGAGLTAVPWNASWDAEVQSECADALAAYDPPTNTEMEARTLPAASYATAAALDAVDNYVDTEIAALTSELAKVPKSDSTVSFNATALGAIADAVADEAYDGTVTLRQSVRLQNSAAAGKLSGAATASVKVRDLADSKDRITATVDADGNRTAVTTDVA